ncbi:glycoside hydrolase family 127 protein [Butyrivibrio sp. WCE2006]|uniref:glycoside hydrolase family 127 protein n=1 Tax=Butyrivibrio sp. WCE2006 TaxID=1410611 RepID=UPI0005D1B3D0|nr:beta-L-arabinofuranosidase domain-containing protein [Butyrivibrio sp. WCE2006]
MFEEYKLSQVLAIDEYYQNALEKDVAYLKSIDPDRMLAGFYENAGLAPKKMRYTGWENMLIGGHTMGHYLTAASQGYANPGTATDDKKALIELIKKMVDGLYECQQHSKGKPGFVFGAAILDSNNVEQQFDNVEEGKTNIITEAWVPWYTMHKILDGLVNTYILTGYETSLKVAEGIGDWSYGRTSSWSEDTHRTVLGIEYGGMNDALYKLYKLTGKKEHLEAAHAFDEDELFKKILTGDANVLNNRHANTTIPKFLGALNRYMTVGESASEYLEYVKAFWDMVVTRHTYVTGGNSEWEHFGEDYVLDAERTNCNNETCNTYNMLKMSRDLFRITGDKKYADYYENTWINAILSSQNPEDGMTMYFQPMATGYYKVYGQPFDKFWCCTGTGMENFTKLGDSIYFKDEEGIIVNLYVSSEVTDDEKKISIRQDTKIPMENTALFTISCENESLFSLKFRVPDWAKSYTCNVVGSEDTFEAGTDGYIEIKRQWNDKDQVEITFEMMTVAKTLPDCDNVFAFKYGPVVLSANLGTENMVDGTTGVDVTIPTNKIAGNEYLTINEGSVTDFVSNIDKHMVRENGTLNFNLTGTDRDLQFTPHYKKTRERYGIYWYLFDDSNSDTDEVEKRKAEEARRESIIDTVQPGYGQYENDELHAMEDNGSVGSTAQGTTRAATPNGSFTYHMKAVEGADLLLEVHYLREDNGKQICIRIGDETIFNGKLHYTGREEEYFVEYPISKEIIAKALEHRTVGGSEVFTVPVTFSGSFVIESARIFGFVYMRK